MSLSSQPHQTIEVPPLRHIAHDICCRVAEAVLIPLGLFYLASWVAGTWAGLWALVLWVFALTARRTFTSRAIPTLLAMSSLFGLARLVTALVMGSTDMFFIPQIVITAVSGVVLAASIPAERPLLTRLAFDVLGDVEMLSHPAVDRFLRHLSALWAIVMLGVATASILLLVSVDVGTYVGARTAISTGLQTSAVVLSIVWFRVTMRRNGLQVAWQH